MNSGIVAGLFTGMQVGAALFLSQLVVADVGVGLLGLLRYGIALLCLAPLLLLRKTRTISRTDWPKIVLLGMGQVAVMISLLNLAVLFTSAARVALIFATLPAISLCIDKLKGEVSGNWLSNLGIALSIGSVAVLVGHDAFAAALTIAQLTGMGAALAATIVVATCSSMYRPYVVRYGSAKISVIGFSVSLAPLVALATLSPSATAFAQWHPATVWLVLAIGISSGVGYLTWFHALARLPATRVTGFLALNPVTAAVLSLIFTGAPLTPTLLVSVCLVCLGIACFALSPPPAGPATRRPRPGRPASGVRRPSVAQAIRVGPRCLLHPPPFSPWEKVSAQLPDEGVLRTPRPHPGSLLRAGPPFSTTGEGRLPVPAAAQTTPVPLAEKQEGASLPAAPTSLLPAVGEGVSAADG